MIPDAIRPSQSSSAVQPKLESKPKEAKIEAAQSDSQGKAEKELALEEKGISTIAEA